MGVFDKHPKDPPPSYPYPQQPAPAHYDNRGAANDYYNSHPQAGQQAYYPPQPQHGQQQYGGYYQQPGPYQQPQGGMHYGQQQQYQQGGYSQQRGRGREAGMMGMCLGLCGALLCLDFCILC